MQMGFSQKTGCGGLERDEWRRAALKLMVSCALGARSLVFLDEMDTNVSRSPL
jgi:hypothetical protein